MKKEWKRPELVVYGTLGQLTGDDTINKSGISGDVIVYGGQSIPVPGSGGCCC